MGELEIVNAVITDAHFDTERGCLSAWVFLDYGGSGQGFGGFVLYAPPNDLFAGPRGNYAGLFIWRVLQIAGVDDWSKLKGRTVRARRDHGHVQAIGHIVKNDWFNPSDDFKRLEAEAVTHG